MNLSTAIKAYVCDVTTPMCIPLRRLTLKHRLYFAVT
jgi:hypothetical protein